MIVVGAYLQISNASYMKLVPSDDFFTATALMIASGTIVIVVCLFGFAGVLMESQCFLGIVSKNPIKHCTPVVKNNVSLMSFV